MSAGVIFPAAYPPSARVRSDGGQDINLTPTDNLVLWLPGTFQGNPLFSMVANTGIQVARDGFVKVSAQVAYITGVQRYNGLIKFRVAGAVQPARGSSGYVRSASGNNEASLWVEDILPVVSGDVIEVLIDREAVIGNVVTQANQGVFMAEYVEAS